MSSGDLYGLRRNVDKQIDLTVDEYNGSARPGELIVDMNPQGSGSGPQYTLYVAKLDGTLQAVGTGGGGGGGSGTVSSIATSTSDPSGLGFTMTGGPITSSGTITLGVPSGAALRASMTIGNVANVNLNGNGLQVLAGNGSWVALGGGGGSSGTVTSIATSTSDPSGLGFTISGGPITASGTVTLTVPTSATLRGSMSIGNVANTNFDGNVSNILRGDGTWGAAGGGGGTAASIANGTSGVSIPTSGGNVITSVGGATILTVTSTGANIAGTANITGVANLGSDLNVAGNVSIAGNVTSAITANAAIPSTSTTTGTIVLAGVGGIGLESGNIHVGGNANVAGNFAVTGTANVTGKATINDTLTTNKAIIQKYTTLASTAIDCAAADYFRRTGSLTLTASNIAPTGSVTSFILDVVNGTGALTISGVTPKWQGGTAYTPTAAGIDIIGLYTHDAGTTWRGIVLSLDSK